MGMRASSGVVTHAQGILGLVDDAFARRAMDIVVLCATHLVHGGLRVRLGRVGLRLTGNLVGGAGQRFLDLCAGRL
jgi:hypothetical protein